MTPFITAVVTFLLLGTENIGIQIEEPFEVLPLEVISDACAAGVQDLMQAHAGEPLFLQCNVLFPRTLNSATAPLNPKG